MSCILPTMLPAATTGGAGDAHTPAMVTEATSDLRASAERLLPGIVAVRRRLHRRPEIGLELPATQAVVTDELRALGLTPSPGRRVGSVTAEIAGGQPGPVTVLRADMDGLPLQEDTGLPFASETTGTMHACGHDTHMAMLLGAARLLVARQNALRGRVLLMFQPGEEGYHGARFMLEDGLLEGLTADDEPRAFALHISTRYPTGTVRLRPGAMLAGSDRIELTVRGRGGHASAPHLARDPIVAVAELVLALQTAVTRRIDVFDPAVITIARIAAGTTNNIIPEAAVIEGTMRSVSERTREALRALVREVANGVGATHGVEVDVVIDPGYPVTMNDPVVTAAVRELAVALAGDEAVAELRSPIMGAEDFSYVLQRVPGMMAFLGARPPDQDEATAPQNHSNRVVFDETPMALGAALYAAVALDR
jgi:amidohydrolase